MAETGFADYPLDRVFKGTLPDNEMVQSFMDRVVNDDYLLEPSNDIASEDSLGSDIIVNFLMEYIYEDVLNFDIPSASYSTTSSSQINETLLFNDTLNSVEFSEEFEFENSFSFEINADDLSIFNNIQIDRNLQFDNETSLEITPSLQIDRTLSFDDAKTSFEVASQAVLNNALDFVASNEFNVEILKIIDRQIALESLVADDLTLTSQATFSNNLDLAVRSTFENFISNVIDESVEIELLSTTGFFVSEETFNPGEMLWLSPSSGNLPNQVGTLNPRELGDYVSETFEATTLAGDSNLEVVYELVSGEWPQYYVVENGRIVSDPTTREMDEYVQEYVEEVGGFEGYDEYDVDGNKILSGGKYGTVGSAADQQRTFEFVVRAKDALNYDPNDSATFADRIFNITVINNYSSDRDAFIREYFKDRPLYIDGEEVDADTYIQYMKDQGYYTK